MPPSRREFLRRVLGAGLAAPGLHLAAGRAEAAPAQRFPDLARHFIVEYYPWYGTDPMRHWDAEDRVPPDDVATNYYPRSGPTTRAPPRRSNGTRGGSSRAAPAR